MSERIFAEETRNKSEVLSHVAILNAIEKCDPLTNKINYNNKYKKEPMIGPWGAPYRSPSKMTQFLVILLLSELFTSN